MTANQIAWWNIQEQIRSHMQNELNARNQNSITESIGNEQNRITNKRMQNDFILGQQGNMINQQQADTAVRRASQDYDIGKKTVANQERRNAQDYEIGTTANKIKATEVKNQYILGSVANQNQSIRNAQDFAIGNKQQNTNVRLADAALLSAGAQVGKLSPAGVVVALTAPELQKGVQEVVPIVTNQINKTVQTVNKTVKKTVDKIKQAPPTVPKGAIPVKGSRVIAPKPIPEKPKATKPAAKPKAPAKAKDPRAVKGRK